MKVRLIVHEWDDWPSEFKDQLTDPWAYTVGNEIHLRGARRISAIQHELWHLLEHMMNTDHHPWYHFCVASYNPIRFDYHGLRATKSLAERLAAVGEVEVPE